MGNFRINSDFRIENFHFKHEIFLLLLFKRPSFCVKSSYLHIPEITLKLIIKLMIISYIAPDKKQYPHNNFLIPQ